MLLGGVPSRLQSLIQDSELGTVESLAGCLSDFQLDYEYVVEKIFQNFKIQILDVYQ